MNFFRNLLQRPSPRALAVKVEDPVAFYLDGNGRMQAVKSSGYIASQFTRIPISHLWANAEQYARAAIASVWAANCINLRADTQARLRYHVRDRKSQKPVDDHPFEIALRQSKQNIIRRLERTQLTHGETFIKPLHNEYGYPSALHVLNNLDVEVDTSRGYVQGFLYMPRGLGRTYTYTPKELIFIHNENEFDDHRGISKFEHIMIEIGIDVDISRTTRAFYANDARPGLLLIPEFDLTPTNAEEFIESWNAQLKGPDKAGRPILVPKAVREVKEFQRAPSIDDVELRKSTRREICAAFKVPLSMAGAWDDATYQSLPEQRKAFYEETIIPGAEGHARELTQQVLPWFEDDDRFEVYFDASVILALTENTLELVDIGKRKLDSGGYTLNEYRAFLGDDPIAGGDIHIMQSGWIPVRSDELATFEAPNTAAAPDEPIMTVQAEEIPALPESTRAHHEHTHDPVVYVPDETIEVKTVHAAALKELRAWQKFVANGNADKREFRVYMIRDDLNVELQTALLAAGEDSAAIKAAFKIAETQIAIKTNDAVRAEFELEIKTLIDRGRSGKLPRRNFTNRLKTTIRRDGPASFISGLRDGGVIVEAFNEVSTEDAAVVEGLLAEHLRNVTGLSESIFKAGLSDAQARLKPRQWYGGTIKPFYDAGLLSSARNQMVEFVGPIDENSCDSCKALVGQRHRRRAFAAAGFMPPYGSKIICSDGKLCKHRLISVNSRARGHLARAPKR